jgi:ribose 5-phosphate isomerase A
MPAGETDALKKAAAEYAVALIEPGMVVGLGVGSTAIHATRRIGARVAAGELEGIVCVPCSLGTEQAARELGLPLTTLEEHPEVDLTIDGADEVDPNMDLIKGAGGALLREKIVAQATRREVIVIDEGKLSPNLGTRSAVPVEVVEFGRGATIKYLRQLGCEPKLRLNGSGKPFRTDQGNLIVDCEFRPIEYPDQLDEAIRRSAGVVEHGLFLGLATDLVVAGAGGIRHYRRGDAIEMRGGRHG